MIFIRKKITGYLKNLTENSCEKIEEYAIVTKNKIIYTKNEIKHTIYIKNNEIILIRENSIFKNILTFSLKRSILSEYIVKQDDLCLEVNVNTLELLYNQNKIYIKYVIQESNDVFEYSLMLEE